MTFTYVKTWCTINNAHLGNPLVFAKFQTKITHSVIIFNSYFCLIFTILIQALHSKAKVSFVNLASELKNANFSLKEQNFGKQF
jgi:hypothetical protein